MILALDLGVSTGFAIGPSGQLRDSGTVRLKAKGESIDVAFGNLIAFVNEKLQTSQIELVAKEKMLSLQAFMALGNAEATVRAHGGYHAIVEGLCVRHGVRWEEAADSTIRKHFIGRSKVGTREATKDAVVQRCKLLKLMPEDCKDDNRADAIAVHDWAGATFMGRIPTELHLFGERRTREGQGHAG